MIHFILQDWAANAGNPKSRLALALFRLAQWVRALPAPWWWLGAPLIALYVLVVEWGLGIELNHKSKIGPGLRLYHGTGLVIHEGAVIGSNCLLRHATTIGGKGDPPECPVIGDDVEIGSNAVILGGVRIGRGAIVGAGSVVLRDVEPGTTVAGNPARVIGASGPAGS